ncbi:MAG: hypothetical protein ABSC34_03700 [Acidimicrobiales bacterium]
MAKSASGKWVSRVGATGGGKAYKKSRPSNYYGVLAVIVILGLLSAVLARYDYQHPHKAAGATPPAIGTTWYAALSIQACGETLPALTPDPSSVGGFQVGDYNVIKLSPASAADSGNNATLSQFSDEYPSLTATSSELSVPNKKFEVDAATTYKNGQACPAKTKDAGQTGKVTYDYWSKLSQKNPTVTTNPATIKFSEYMRVVMAFEPAGVKPTPPSALTVDTMVKDAATATTTTTTTLATTTTTTSGTTTTTTAPTTTTTKG